MMGSRGTKGYHEIEILNGRWVRFKPKTVRYFKRKFWKRKRNETRRDADRWIKHGASE
jgi:hypothetical protein